MATELVADAPGGIGEVIQCPYCSRQYIQFDPDKNEAVEVPRKCRRCGSPMDLESAQKFQDDMAAAAATATPRPERRTRKR